MRETLLVVGLFVLALGLRSSRSGIMRKMGALMILVAGFVMFAAMTDCTWCGMLGVVPWLMLPWVELLTRIRRMRLPLENRLQHREAPDPAFFPNAEEAAHGMEDEGFEHVDDCGWEWSGMQQYFRLYWHPEERAEAAVCLCEQEQVAFAFMTITSRDEQGRIWRTTNFPFSPTLRCAPEVHWNHVPCERNEFKEILEDHRIFLKKVSIGSDQLRVPDPDQIEHAIEEEMKTQVRHNLETGVLKPSGSQHFEYSVKGLFFLWMQFLKDMIRLC